MKLVIVESPAKARTIGKMLGKEYLIKASMGHVRDLPQRSFGVDIENGFKPQYEESKGRGKNLSDLKSAAKSADEIYLAPDPDREGEAIAWHLKEILSKGNKKAKFRRVSFHEITRNAIARAFRETGDLDMNLVDSQQARRVLDRMVGYMVSPLLWSRIEKGISAGRVQSVALKLVCERERQILAFVPKEYWNFMAGFDADGRRFTARLARIGGEKFEVGDASSADAVLKAVRGARQWKVASVENTPRKRYASPPFITSTLQQAASSVLRFSASFTMKIAQQLYEGVDVGSGGPSGLITYMRTDSVAVAAEAQSACRSFIASAYGPEYVPSKPNFYKSKASAQGAHEAIRPTDVSMTPDSLKGSLDAQQLKLYTIIWRRFVASQMSPAEQMRTTVDVDGTGSDSKLYGFRATTTATTFPGFLRAYNIVEEGAASGDDEEESDALTGVSKGASCTMKDANSEQKFTEPPPRFSEATLIKELESNGIGRPSTYATIVNTIQERNYTFKDKGKLIPTELGFKVNDYLVGTLPDLFQVGFTADMEDKLDKIEEGSVQWTGMLEDFYKHFSGWLSAAKGAGAPAPGKAKALMEAIEKGVRDWEPPEKGGRRTYDDKKFFNSVLEKFKKGTAISARQWEALLSLSVKYSDQIGGLDACASKNGFAEDLDGARRTRQERAAAREEAAQSAPPQDALADAFKTMSAIKWDAPEKRGPRVYDDGKFFSSLKKQHDSGKALSEKQIAVIVRMATKYKSQIKDFDSLSESLGIDLSASAGGASPATQSPAASAEADKLLDALSKVVSWADPVKKGRRVYDDKEFYGSLSKQRASGKTLSDKQIAALRRMAAKYSSGNESS